MKKGKAECQDRAELEGDELEKYKSLVNTIQQECSDKNCGYESKVRCRIMQIYELEIKAEKLEKQLREGQEVLIKDREAKRKLEMAEVEHVHERDQYRLSLRERKPHHKAKKAISFYQ